MRYGSFQNCLAAMRGEAVVAVPNVLDLGTVVEGTEAVGTFEVRNLSGRTVSILGASTDCGCMATGDFPVTLTPYESKEIAVRVALSRPRDGARFTQTVVYYTSASASTLAVPIVAEVSEATPVKRTTGEPTSARGKAPD